MAIGMPGCPLLAFWTASTARNRMVFTQVSTKSPVSPSVLMPPPLRVVVVGRRRPAPATPATYPVGPPPCKRARLWPEAPDQTSPSAGTMHTNENVPGPVLPNW